MDIDSYDDNSADGDETFTHSDILEHFPYLKDVFPPNMNADNKTKQPAAEPVQHMSEMECKQEKEDVALSSTSHAVKQGTCAVIPQMPVAQSSDLKQEIETGSFIVHVKDQTQNNKSEESQSQERIVIKQESQEGLTDSRNDYLVNQSMETEQPQSVQDKPTRPVKVENIMDNGFQVIISPEFKSEENTSALTEDKASNDKAKADTLTTQPDSDIKESNDSNPRHISLTSSCFTSVHKANKNKPKVCFIVKGKFGPDMNKATKYVRALLMEQIDSEEVFFDNVVKNYCVNGNCKEAEKVNIKELDKENEPSQDVIAQSQGGNSTENLGNNIKPDASAENAKENDVSTSIRKVSSKSLDESIADPVPCVYLDTRYGYQLNPDLLSVIANAKKSANGLEYQVPQQPQFSTQSSIVPSTPKTTSVKEPSLAEIRASLYPNEHVSLPFARFADGSFEDNETPQTMNLSVSSTAADEQEEIEMKTPIRSARLAQSAYKFYDLTMEDLNQSDDERATVLSEGIKGGRSDPDNPFAITSPSFSDSAAKALLTTTQTSTATIVTVSVMSIGGREKLIPQITESEAAAGGIVSIGNPIKTGGKDNKPSYKANKDTSTSTNKDTDNSPTLLTSKIDRLDINIRIEDKQYKGSGENKRWLCRMCEKSYTTKHNLVTHILDHMGVKPHLCLLCGKYFKQLCHLNTHMLTHDKVRPYICSVCNKGFTQISHLKRHETVHSGKPYSCDICQRGFAFPSELKIHKAKHISPEEKCATCGQEFPSHRALQQHKNSTKHGARDELTCVICGKLFQFPSLLRDHMMKHEGVRPYRCTQCHMDFMKEHHLKAHMLTHTGEKPFKCDICDRAFNQKANLNRHKLIHKEGRTMLECELCLKTFSQPQTLKAHMITHQDDKPHKCPICDKQFSRRHNLQGHMHLHNDSRPFLCALCQATFTLKSNLNRHKRYKHGLDETTENMEVDAVTFLSNRARVTSTPDSGSSEATRTTRRGRKSKPTRHISSSVKVEEGSLSETELEEGISYSDEERENERLMGLSAESFTLIKNVKGHTEKTQPRPPPDSVDYKLKEGDTNTDENKSLDASYNNKDDIVKEISCRKRIKTETDQDEAPLRKSRRKN